MEIIITLAIVLFSAIVHEVSHGVVAEKFGDDTAREDGRITLNPISHIDPFGSILLPLMLFYATQGQLVFGAAKPVPVNFNNMRNPKLGMAVVSLAGPFSNFAIAIGCILIIKLGLANSIAGPILLKAALLNIVLGTFNLIPIPPLDGSKILAAIGPDKLMYRLLSWERYGFILVLIFLALGLLDKVLIPVIVLFSTVFKINLFMY